MEPVDPRIDPALVPKGSKATVIAEHQDEFKDLPSVRTPPFTDDAGRVICPGYVVTRWTLSDAERTAILRGEDVYITIISGGSINPLFATVGPVDWTTA